MAGTRVGLVMLLLCAAAAAVAEPWLPPGDQALRHDIQLLADSGILVAPVTTWPMSWPDIARQIGAADAATITDSNLIHALGRVQDGARRAARAGFSGWAPGLAAAERPTALRTFASTPRAEAEGQVRGSWLGDRFAVNLSMAAVSDAADGQAIRLDGSYLGVTLGNLLISAGAMERWWGPGWEGSLILSSNARPIPALAIDRNISSPFRSPLLRWLGPWRASIALGKLEDHAVAVPGARFVAARVNFRPRPWIEVGLSRSAQTCGDSRPCDLENFADLLLGRDNRDPGESAADEPGNQLAGYDLRVRSPWPALPLAVYVQAIGEDEAGGLPSKFLGQLGAEWWGGTPLGSYRAHFEYADTACNFSRRDPQFDCAYRNGLYPQGYAFRGRAIGHSLDGDGRMYSIGVMLAQASGASWSALLRRVELNRGGVASETVHTVSPAGDQLHNLELQYNRAFRWGVLGVGLGIDEFSETQRSDRDVHGFVQWRRGI